MFGWRLRQHPVSEIEDERPAAERIANRTDLLLHHPSSNKQCDRVEIALHRDPSLQLLAGERNWNRGIDTDRIDAGFRDIARIEEPGPAGKADYRNRRKALLQPMPDAPCRLDNPPLEAALG